MPAKRIAPAHCRHGSSDVHSTWPSTAWRHRTFDERVDLGVRERRSGQRRVLGRVLEEAVAALDHDGAVGVGDDGPDAEAAGPERRPRQLQRPPEGGLEASQWGPIGRHRNLRACAARSSPSGPSCSSGRSSTRTRRGSASSSRWPGSTPTSRRRWATTGPASSSRSASPCSAATPSSSAAGSARPRTTSPGTRWPR